MFQFAIQARDGGSPFRAGQVEVEVTVLRTQGQLAFDAANYNLTISENRPAGSVITTVRAQPGVGLAPLLFFSGVTVDLCVSC